MMVVQPQSLQGANAGRHKLPFRDSLVELNDGVGCLCGTFLLQDAISIKWLFPEKKVPAFFLIQFTFSTLSQGASLTAIGDLIDIGGRACNGPPAAAAAIFVTSITRLAS